MAFTLLKSFLRYAESGYMDVPVATGRPPDSPFEEQVLRELERLGYTVHTQVGTAGFYLDMAVVDPLKPGRYSLGNRVRWRGLPQRSFNPRPGPAPPIRPSVPGLEDSPHLVNGLRSESRRQKSKHFVLRSRTPRRSRRARQTAPTSASSFRESEVEPTVARVPERPSPGPKVPSYVFAELDIDLGFLELHAQSYSILFRSGLRESFRSKARFTGSRRLGESRPAAGVQRVGSRIQEAFRRACRSGSRAKRFVYRDDFLWADESFNVVVRDRSEVPAQFKRLDYIAPEEIKAAIDQSVGASFGMVQDEVATSACRMLGFARVSEDMRVAVEQLRDAMLKEGRLVLQGETVVRDVRDK